MLYTTTKKPTTTTTKAPIKLTTTRSPSTSTVTTKSPVIPTVPTVPKAPTNFPIMEIKLNDKVNSLYSESIKLDKIRDFLCYVEGLSSVDFFSDPNGIPDLLAVYGIKDISEVRSTSLPGILKQYSSKVETKTINVSMYKYILISVNKDVPISGNDFYFVVKGDQSLLKSPILVPNNPVITTTLRPTTTKAPVVPSTPNSTTTKAPVTTKTPSTTKSPISAIKSILDKSTPIKLNTKVTDFDKAKTNCFVCNIEGLSTVSVFMNPFATQNSFNIIGIDANGNPINLFASSWKSNSKFIPINILKYKFKQLYILIDNGMVYGNSFEIKVIGDEKLLKTTTV